MKKQCAKKKLTENLLITLIAQNKLANRLSPETNHPSYGYWCGKCKSYHLTRQPNKNFDVDPKVILKKSKLVTIAML